MGNIKRNYYVLRLLPKDKELIQSLGGENDDDKTRYEVLLDLMPIVKKLKRPEKPKRTRHPVRIGIPTDLKREMLAAKKRLKMSSMTEILLLAARKYREQHPLKTEK
jgi:hypothetical protein